MRQKLVVGNWKMNGGFADNAALLAALLAADPGEGVAVAPPALYLTSVAARLAGSSVSLAAQNLAAEGAKGAFTGEISAPMLAEAGVRFVIVGHSERRQYYGETDAMAAAKCRQALTAGLTPILCVGETLPEREAGQAEAVVGRQLAAVITACGVAALARMVVAYEPVWAIGTGRTATPEDANAIHAFLRARVAVDDPAVAASLCILYGGSVKADNAASLFAMPDIDGGLVGGASLIAKDFLAICRAAGLVGQG